MKETGIPDLEAVAIALFLERRQEVIDTLWDDLPEEYRDDWRKLALRQVAQTR